VSLQLRGFQPSVIEFYWILPWVMAVWWISTGRCCSYVDSSQVLWHFVGFFPVWWHLGEFQPGYTAGSWIPAKCYVILLDFTSCNGSLVNFNRVSLQIRGFQPSVMALCWTLPRAMAVWWISTGPYCSYVDSSQMLWYFIGFYLV
jgi:hypothetical protein